MFALFQSGDAPMPFSLSDNTEFAMLHAFRFYIKILSTSEFSGHNHFCLNSVYQCFHINSGLSLI